MWLRDVVELTPYFGYLIGTAIVALGVEAAVLEVARRRRAVLVPMKRAARSGRWEAVADAHVPGPWAEIAGLLGLLLVPLVTIASVKHARAMVAASILEGRAAERAALLWAGLAGQLHAMRLGIVLEELIGALGVVAVSLAFTARRYTAGIAIAGKVADRDPIGAKAWLRFPGPDTETVVACGCAVSALAFLPMLQGVVSYCALLLGRLAPLAGAPPGELAARVAHVDVILIEARRALDSGASASSVGFGLAVATCGVLLWWRAPARSRRRWLGRAAPPAPSGSPRRAAGPWIAGACALLAAVALWSVAEMLRARHDTLPVNAVTPAAQAGRRG